MNGLALVFGAGGWVVGAVALALLRRRLELVARAEHELRGAVTALGLACRGLPRGAGGRRGSAGLAHPSSTSGRFGGADSRQKLRPDVLDAQLARLGAGLNDLTAARSGRRPAPRPGPTELGSVTQAALAPWKAQGAGFSWLGGPVVANLDRGGLAKVLGNLVANAAEHGGGPISVRGRSTRGGVRIEVRNANPRQSAPAPQSESRAPAPPLGRGRGLLIADQAARDLGGRLLVEVGERETVAVLDLPRLAGGDEESAA